MVLVRQNTGKWQHPKKNKKYSFKTQKHGESVLFMSESLRKQQKRTKRHKLGTKCNSFQPVFHILCTKKRNIYGQLHFPYRTGTCFLLACNCGFGLFALPEDS